jgi:hypothetical protein
MVAKQALVAQALPMLGILGNGYQLDIAYEVRVELARSDRFCGQKNCRLGDVQEVSVYR